MKALHKLLETRVVDITIEYGLKGYEWLNSMTITCRPVSSLQWCHREGDGVSNNQCLDCLLNRLFRCRSKYTFKLWVTGHCWLALLVTGAWTVSLMSLLGVFALNQPTGTHRVHHISTLLFLIVAPFETKWVIGIVGLLWPLFAWMASEKCVYNCWVIYGLMVPGQYLNPIWVITIGAIWHSPG